MNGASMRLTAGSPDPEAERRGRPYPHPDGSACRYFSGRTGKCNQDTDNKKREKTLRGNIVKKYYWKPYFGSDRYFICTVSETSRQLLQHYIKNQDSDRETHLPAHVVLLLLWTGRLCLVL